MPTYEYQCSKCQRVFEIRQRITEPSLTVCTECGGAVRRLLSAAPFILKGEGWYVTDYPSEARKKARESEKSGDTKPAAEKSSGEQSSTSPAASSTTTPASSEGTPAKSSSGTPAKSSSGTPAKSSDGTPATSSKGNPGKSSGGTASQASSGGAAKSD